MRYCVDRGLLLIVMVGFVASARAEPNDHYSVTVTIEDSKTGESLPGRLYLRNEESHQPFYFDTTHSDGSAVAYQKQNWVNAESVEYHTTVSAHPATASVPPGTYRLIVEYGKEYFPHQQLLDVDQSNRDVTVKLRRWIDNAARNWYSGDTHIHRSLEESANVAIAEDLNVVFPLTYWVTHADTLPSAGSKSSQEALPHKLVKIDQTHVIWPRNTEYEIFTVSGMRHTLGALFVMGHSGELQETVPPWKPVIRSARQSNPQVMFDMDKLDWPFAMVLPTLAENPLYELANNHMWRTDFAFQDWNTRAPGYMIPPFGSRQGGERKWIDYTLGMYYSLLNCGFQLPPSAGTANGVHPVPAGFGRVYVHLPDGFNYQDWVDGLKSGRSFVTTGPMLYAKLAGKHPGETFSLTGSDALSIALEAEVHSTQPLTFGEVVVNGQPLVLLRPPNQKTESGAYRSQVAVDVPVERSGWVAVRFWEESADGRTRFVHSAPWYISVDDLPVLPRPEEKRYLVHRMQQEIARSRRIIGSDALAEYQQALQFYQSLDVWEDPAVLANARRPTDDTELRRWLNNMLIEHGYTRDEVRAATGLSVRQIDDAIERFDLPDPDQSWTALQHSDARATTRLLPYPGGRHPRRGFLDGAIQPQRDTKLSVFPPWPDAGYVVVDLPEAVFSNLGLTYLAHTHVPTIWSEQDVSLNPVEWQRQADGSFLSQRELPNGIRISGRAWPRENGVDMRLSLFNGTDQPLTGMRAQVCVMLKGAVDFNDQSTLPTVISKPGVAIRAKGTNRWIISAWTPCDRVWANPPVPCIHADPLLPDCDPGETVHARGRMVFYEGSDVRSELEKLTHERPRREGEATAEP